MHQSLSQEHLGRSDQLAGRRLAGRAQRPIGRLPQKDRWGGPLGAQRQQIAAKPGLHLPGQRALPRRTRIKGDVVRRWIDLVEIFSDRRGLGQVKLILDEHWNPARHAQPGIVSRGVLARVEVDPLDVRTEPLLLQCNEYGHRIRAGQPRVSMEREAHAHIGALPRYRLTRTRRSSACGTA